MEGDQDQVEYLRLLFVWETCNKFAPELRLEKINLQMFINAIYDQNMSSLLFTVIYAFITVIVSDFAYEDEEGLARTGLPASLDLKFLNVHSWSFYLFDLYRFVYGKQTVQGIQMHQKLSKHEAFFISSEDMFQEMKLLLKICLSSLVSSSFKTKYVEQELKKEKNALSSLLSNLSQVARINEIIKGEDTVENTLDALIDFVELTSCLAEEDFRVPATKAFFEEVLSPEFLMKSAEQSISSNGYLKSKELFQSVEQLIEYLSVQFKVSEEFKNTQNLALFNIEETFKQYLNKMETHRSNIDNRSHIHGIVDPTLAIIRLMSQLKNSCFNDFPVEDKIALLEFLAHEVIDTELLSSRISEISNEFINLSEEMEENHQDRKQAIERLNKDSECEEVLIKEAFEEIEFLLQDEDDPFLGLPFVFRDSTTRLLYQGNILKRLRYGEHKLKYTLKNYFSIPQDHISDSEEETEMDTENEDDQEVSTLPDENLASRVLLSSSVLHKYTELEQLRYRCLLSNQESRRVSLRDICASNVLLDRDMLAGKALLPVELLSFRIQGRIILLKNANIIHVFPFGFGSVLKRTGDIFTIKFQSFIGYISINSINTVLLDKATHCALLKSIRDYRKETPTVESIEDEFEQKLNILKKKLEDLASIGLDLNKYIVYQIEGCFKLFLVSCVYLYFDEDTKRFRVLSTKNIKTTTGIHRCAIQYISSNSLLSVSVEKLDHYLYTSHIPLQEMFSNVESKMSLSPIYRYDSCGFLYMMTRKILFSCRHYIPKIKFDHLVQVFIYHCPNFTDTSNFQLIVTTLLTLENLLLDNLPTLYEIDDTTGQKKLSRQEIMETGSMQYGFSSVLPPVADDFPFFTEDIFNLPNLNRKLDGSLLTRNERSQVRKFFAAVISVFFERFGEQSGYTWKLSNAEISNLVDLLFDKGFHQFESLLFAKYGTNLRHHYSKILNRKVVEAETSKNIHNQVPVSLKGLNPSSIYSFLTEWVFVRRTWRTMLQRYNTNDLSPTQLLQCLHTFDQALSLLSIETEETSGSVSFRVGDILVYDKARHVDIVKATTSSDEPNLYSFLSHFQTQPKEVSSQSEFAATRLFEFQVYYVKNVMTTRGMVAILSVGPLKRNVKLPDYIPDTLDKKVLLSQTPPIQTQITKLNSKQKFCYVCLRGGLLVKADSKESRSYFHLSCLRLIKPVSVNIFDGFHVCPLVFANYRGKKTLEEVIVTRAILKAIDGLLIPNNGFSKVASAYILPVRYKRFHNLNCLSYSANKVSCLADMKIHALRGNTKSKADVFSSISLFMKTLEKVDSAKFPLASQHGKQIGESLNSNFMFYLQEEINWERHNARIELENVLIFRRKKLLEIDRVVTICLKEVKDAVERRMQLQSEQVHQFFQTPNKEKVVTRRSTRRKKQVRKLEMTMTPMYSRKRRKIEDTSKKNKMLARLQSNLSVPPPIEGDCRTCSNCIVRAQHGSSSFIRMNESLCLNNSSLAERRSGTVYKFRYRGVYFDKIEYLTSTEKAVTIKDVNFVWDENPRLGIEAEHQRVYTFIVSLVPSSRAFIATRKHWRELRIYEDSRNRR